MFHHHFYGHRGGGGWVTTDLLRTVEHAAVWRLMWHLSPMVLVVVGLLAFVLLRGRRA